VERAISALEGRHPEHERVRRETLAAAATRRRALDDELAARARRRWKRAGVVAANAIAFAVAGAVGWRLFTRARALRGELAEAEARFVPHGLSEIATNALTAARSLDVDVPGSRCLVAVAGGGATVRVRRGSSSAEARGSVGWCTCRPERATVEAGPDAPEKVGLAVLAIDARATGGPHAREWLAFAPAVWAEGGAECAESTLDGWIADGRAPRAPVEAAASWLGEPGPRGSLREAGFRAIAAVPADRPFGVVESAAGECVLALSAERGAGDLSLRATGGAWLVSHAPGALAWCSSTAMTATLWRGGRTAAFAVAAPAARVGGLLGTRECAEAAQVPVDPQAVWVRDEDLPWDAEALLRASGVTPAPGSALPAEPGPTDVRIEALALAAKARVAVSPEAAVIACDPPLSARPGVRETVCAGAVPFAWWRQGDDAAAGARAAVPFWLSLLEGRREPDAIARVPELVSLARRLARAGFEPTVFQGVAELADGIRVTGRAGEDAIVAVGIGPKPPWTFPYTDGVPWDLGDSPRVVELQPGALVKLASTPAQSAPIDKRRTIVFRHAIAHP
jgi:hypothetical protein